MLIVAVSSCGTPGTTTSEKSPPSTTVTKENLFRTGHEYFVDRNFDSAEVFLLRSLSHDSTYLPPLADLASMHYDRAMREQGNTNPVQATEFRKAFGYYARMESLGRQDADTYDRLCEVTHALGEKEKFLAYATKSAAKFPDDRQYYNLGLAYAQVGDYASVIITQKEAIEKFKFSSFVGSFYRQLGNAYVEVDRKQTAEKTFTTGVQVVTNRLAELQNASQEAASSPEVRRLTDDKVGMLLSLKKLYVLYKEDEKLHDVESELAKMGHIR